MIEKDPDDDATRQRRRRAHKRGDHSLCRPEHCQDAPTDAPPPFVMPPGMSVVDAVLDYVDELPVLSDAGPQMVMSRAALALASAIDRGQPGIAANVRELQAVMAHLGEVDTEGPLDEVRAKRAERRARLLTEINEGETPS